MDNYLIKKGNHFARGWFKRLFHIHCNVSKVIYEGYFGSKCWWYPPRDHNDEDLNKLCGLGFGLNHHFNSIRITWKPDFLKWGFLKLYAYVYDKNKPNYPHISKYICDVELNKKFKVTISGFKSDEYEIKVETKISEYNVTMNNSQKDKKWGFWLYPYFGGNNTAPQDMMIFIKRIVYKSGDS